MRERYELPQRSPSVDVFLVDSSRGGTGHFRLVRKARAAHRACSPAFQSSPGRRTAQNNEQTRSPPEETGKEGYSKARKEETTASEEADSKENGDKEGSD